MGSEQANKEAGWKSEQEKTSHPEGYLAIGEVESFESLLRGIVRELYCATCQTIRCLHSKGEVD
eukprot:490519-Rhodomonas_salina.1